MASQISIGYIPVCNSPLFFLANSKLFFYIQVDVTTSKTGCGDQIS